MDHHGISQEEMDNFSLEDTLREMKEEIERERQEGLERMRQEEEKKNAELKSPVESNEKPAGDEATISQSTKEAAENEIKSDTKKDK